MVQQASSQPEFGIDKMVSRMKVCSICERGLLCFYLCSLTEVDNLIELCTLLGLVGVKLPETVQPGKLHNLLGSEESSNEVRLRRPERGVCIVDVLHRRCAVESILLGSKVVDERSRCEPLGGAVFNAHVDGVVG